MILFDLIKTVICGPWDSIMTNMGTIAEYNATNMADNASYAASMQAARSPPTMFVVPQNDIDIIQNERVTEVLQNNGHLLDLFGRLQANNGILEQKVQRLTMYLDEMAKNDSRINLDDELNADETKKTSDKKLQARFHIINTTPVGIQSTSGVARAVSDVAQDSEYLKKVAEHKNKMRKYIEMLDSGKQSQQLDREIERLESKSESMIRQIADLQKIIYQKGSSPQSEAILNELNQEILLIQQDIDAAQAAQEMTFDYDGKNGNEGQVIDFEDLEEAMQNAKKADFNEAILADMQQKKAEQERSEKRRQTKRNQRKELKRLKRERYQQEKTYLGGELGRQWKKDTDLLMRATGEDGENDENSYYPD